LTAFDKDGTFTGIRQGDCFEAVAKVGSRKNDYYKLVDKKGGERVYFEPQYTVESIIPIEQGESDTGQFVSDISEVFPDDEPDADIPF